MSSNEIYDSKHVAICRILGREFNNPLGETALVLLQRLLRTPGRPLVLDAGCGRGATSIWFSVESGAIVDGFDPAEEMLDEAATRISELDIADRIRLCNATIESFVPPDDRHGNYDLVLLHDVLCYSDNPRRDAGKLAAVLRPGGLMSVSTYWVEDTGREIQGVFDAWGIRRPGAFGESFRGCRDMGLATLFQFDTTRQYRDHWKALRNTLDIKIGTVIDEVGLREAVMFAKQIEAILRAVDTGSFGHSWTVFVRDDTPDYSI
jgi:SAM-dependent methyltransferase